MAYLNRRSILWMTTGALSAPLPGALQAKPVRKNAFELPDPREVRRPVDVILRDIGKMGLVYGRAFGDGPIVLEVDFIGSQASSDKLPQNMTVWARNVVEKIGYFQTYSALPGIVDSQRAGGLSPLVVNARPRHPEPTLRLVGSLERATEIEQKGRTGRLTGMGGGGHTQWDSTGSAEAASTVTALTVAFTVEAPNGIAMRGATAQYRIETSKIDRDRAFSFFIAGSGLDLGSKRTTAQELSDALYDAVALNLCHVLGQAVRIPYHRCSPIFVPDPGLESRMRFAFLGLSRSQLELRLKMFMLVDGFQVDSTRADLSDVDRGLVRSELHRRGLVGDERRAMVEMLMQLWNALDYRAAYPRIENMLADSVWWNQEQRELQEREKTALIVTPPEFGWPADARVIVLDVSRIKDPATHMRIIGTMRQSADVRPHPTKALLGLRTSAQRADIQYALTQANGLDCVWLKDPDRCLVLARKQGMAK